MESFFNLAAPSSGRSRSYLPTQLCKFLKHVDHRPIAKICPAPRLLGSSRTVITDSGSQAGQLGSNERFLSIGQVCEMLSASRSWIYEQVACGAFPAQLNLGKRRVVWRLSDVLAFMQLVIDGTKGAAE